MIESSRLISLTRNTTKTVASSFLGQWSLIIDRRIILRHVSYEILLIHGLYSELQLQARCVCFEACKERGLHAD